MPSLTPLPKGTLGVSADPEGTLTLEDMCGAVLANAVQFDISSVGNYLDIQTTGASGITVKATDGPLSLTSTDEMVFTNDGSAGFRFDIVADTAIQILSDGSTVANLLTPTTSSFSVRDSDNNALMYVRESGAFEYYLQSGTTLTVFDSSFNEIFRIDDDGDLHGLTGKALTFDL